MRNIFTNNALMLILLLSCTLLVGCEQSTKENTQPAAPVADENGLTLTVSGLKYKILTQGSGEYPKASDTVTVHYRGTLQDGTEFDSSFKRGEPATFPLTKVISGWTEGLQLVRPGGKIQLIIPSELGYGKGGFGNIIPGGATLNFEVELISIQ